MTLTLNQSDWDDLHQHAPEKCPDHLTLDDFETWSGVPECLGSGYSRGIELVPGMWLDFSEHVYHQDLSINVPAHEHLIQIGIFLSGFLGCSIHPTLGGTRGYFSGSGISPAYVEQHQGGQRLTSINVEIEPALLQSYFEDELGRAEMQHSLFKGEDWKISFYPTVTPALQAIAHQLWNAPYRGMAKRMYLQAKVFELLAMHLDWIANDPAQSQSSPKLKPDTIARLHYAKEILTRQVAHPPSLSELAQQVGVSDRTLQRGFREVFDTTVFGYLHTLRMEQAEQLLRTRPMRVSEVAHAVGYSHLGHFTEAFKRRFGMTPKQCQMGTVKDRNYT
jgi:AraC-like DNA-binding protein